MPNPIMVTTTISAPVETVWNAFTDPQHVTGWNFASDEWHCPEAHGELRVGGEFGSRMAAKDGSMEFDFGGIYTRVEAPTFLAYEMADGRKVQVELEALPDGQTSLTQRFDAEATQPRDMQQAGWQAILENFRQYADRLS